MTKVEGLLLSVSKSLINQYAYYGPAISIMRFEEDNRIQTMAVDKNLVVIYNAKFVEGLSKDELKGVLMHELFHFLSKHHIRRKYVVDGELGTHELHNVCMDLEINCRLLDYGVKLPEGCCLPGTFELIPGQPIDLPDMLTYEQYYRILIEYLKKNKSALPNSNNCGSKDGGVGIKGVGSIDSQMRKIKDDISETATKDSSDGNTSGTDGGEMSDDEYSDLVDSVASTCEKNRGNGSNPGEIMNTVITEKIYPWNIIFRNILFNKSTQITSGCEFRSYRYYNKRNTCNEIFIPTWKGYDTDIDLVVIMDVSGSMYDEVIDMYSKMKSITKYLPCKVNTTILETDTEVINVINDFDLNSRSVRTKLGGGTDLTQGWKYIYDNKLKPDVIVCMTDGYTPYPSKDDPYFYGGITKVISSGDTSDCPYKCYKADMGGNKNEF